MLKNSKMLTIGKNLYNNKTIQTLVAIVFFICMDRSLSVSFMFKFSYRAMTLQTLLLLACTWTTVLYFAYHVYKNIHSINYKQLLPCMFYCVIYICYLVSTAINHGKISIWFDAFFYSFAVFFLVYLIKDRKEFYKYISWFFIVLALLNILFEVVPFLNNYKAQWTENYFLGFENEYDWPMMLGMLFVLLDYKYEKNLPKLVIYIILFYANIAMVFCATAVVGAAIILLYLVFKFVRKMFEKYSFIVFLLIVAILFLCLIVFYNQISQIEFVRFIVEDVLHKDLTLTGRAPFWEKYFEAFLKKPIHGYGFLEKPIISIKNIRLGHAHNEWLDTLYDGGIIALVCALAMMLVCTRFIKCKEVKLMLFVVMVMLQSDMIGYYPWYLVTLILSIGMLEEYKE